MDNPYQSPPASGQVFVQRTVMIDPSGAPVTLSALTERTLITPDGQRLTEVTTSVPMTAEGILLREPCVLYRCGNCGAQPLVRVMRCDRCGRATCAPCTIIENGTVACRACTATTFLGFLIRLIPGVIAWLRPR